MGKISSKTNQKSSSPGFSLMGGAWCPWTHLPAGQTWAEQSVDHPCPLSRTWLSSPPSPTAFHGAPGCVRCPKGFEKEGIILNICEAGGGSYIEALCRKRKRSLLSLFRICYVCFCFVCARTHTTHTHITRVEIHLCSVSRVGVSFPRSVVCLPPRPRGPGGCCPGPEGPEVPPRGTACAAAG